MADPITWAAIGTAVVGATVGAAGAHSAGVAQQQQANAQAQAQNYQAQVADNNAQILDNDAIYSQRAGAVKTQAVNQRGRSMLGSLKASQAANGVDINSGSAVDVRAGESAAARQDTLTTASNADLEAYGYRSQAANQRANAQLDRMGAANSVQAGQAALSASNYGVASSLLSGASSVASKWQTFSAPKSGTP